MEAEGESLRFLEECACLCFLGLSPLKTSWEGIVSYECRYFSIVEVNERLEAPKLSRWTELQIYEKLGMK